MSKFLLLVFCTVMAVGRPVQSRELADIRRSGEIRLATEGTTPPFNFFENGRLIGFDIDIGNAIAARLGVRAVWTAAPFDTVLIGLQQDRYDLAVMGQAITPARQSAVGFSDPYVCSGGVIVALPGGARHVADLAGKIIGVQVGTTYLTAASAIPKVGRVITFQKDTDALQNLLGQRTDVWVSDRLTASYLATSNPALHLQVGDPLFTERDGISLAKGNESLRTAVNQALKAIMADGTYGRIATQRFGKDVRCD
jgi:polar amino acid transport system substrate-binding protein